MSRTRRPRRADDVRVVDGTQGLVAASVTASQVIVNGSVGTFGGCTVAAPQVTCSIKSLNAGGTMDDDDHRAGDHVGRLDDLQHGDGDRKHLEQGRHRDRFRDHDGQAGGRPDDHQGGLA